MGKPDYLLILIGFLLLALWLQRRFRIRLFQSSGQRLVYALSIFIIGFLWDYFSVTQGIWSFPAGGTLGVRLGPLPIEEFMFFVIAPYFGIVLYRVIQKLVR